MATTLGPLGVFLPISFTKPISADRQREAAVRLEHAGCRTVWTNEVVGGKDALLQLAVLMAATERLVFGTAIANIWAREPQHMHAAAAQLAEAYPDRFVLGMGVGYPQQAAATGREFGRPLATMRDYVRRMDEQTWPPAPDVAYSRIIGANGPKMLALAGEIADGALPAGRPPEFTAEARTTLGPDKLLVVALPVAVGTEPAEVAANVREHHETGADHVILMPPMDVGFESCMAYWDELAPRL
ncbi:LLM class flavin-dependent oxidoreductase [Amycolatopsis sp. K13G38]|uniref:LLM class flavin-dependent oxidoreductase n=1 Tax=Amycolatopsis acididurans TaxID=2724524 RepID=A0ABX1J4E4_9PSEU|nr:LLM class flavin-dependent oxidoreductase [Amycolatopsis acididurans]NKQ54663.1 LLM class flavin-dependent oxidoreductase [Amycolatopsis acididurans]